MFTRYLGRTGFRRQMNFVLSVAILVLTVLTSFISAHQGRDRMHAYLTEQGKQIATNLARQSTLALLYHSPENAGDSVATTLAFPDVQSVEITDSAHKVLVSRKKSGTGDTAGTVRAGPEVSLEGMEVALEAESISEWRFVSPVVSGKGGSSPFEMQDAPPELLGYVHVVVGKETLNQLYLSLLRWNMLVSLSVAFAVLGFLNWIIKLLLRPLNSLSKLMARAQAGESALRAKPEGPQDIIDMATSFNQMMIGLDSRDRDLKKSRDEALRIAMTKAQFAANVSHEVRTPLNGVIGMLDLLKEMRLTKRQQECVDVAWSAAQTLLALISDILDFSKIDAGKMTLSEVEFDLRELIEEVIELMARPAQVKRLEIGYFMAPNVPDRIKGDPLRLRQVLNNLLSNALKFTERGEINLHVSESDNTGSILELHFAVQDSGIGMDEHAAGKCFDSFSQADVATSRKYGGTGLGLAISKQLVELMGGTIQVQSAPGTGSTFSFTMKCQQGEPTPVGIADQALVGLRVLVVDASDIVRSFLADGLTKRGMVCFEADTAGKAHQVLLRQVDVNEPIGLIIADIALEDDFGCPLSESLAADATTSSVPLILLDRYNGSGQELRQGGPRVLRKPLQMERLLDTVTSVFHPEELHANTRQFCASSLEESLNGVVRVLVAEDNRTNQKVTHGMLQSFGCLCEIASNGREAVELARSSRFDLVLMDCNMPVMDGYDATGHIRNLEAESVHRVPIIALTANAQGGDAERCMAAGMDDYLAKPLTLRNLGRMVEKWVPHLKLLNGSDESSPILARDGAPIDEGAFGRLKEILGPGIHQAIRPFLEDTPLYIARLREALALDDGKEIHSAAHTIKGSAGNIGAYDLSYVARDIEEMATEGRLGEVALLVPTLLHSFEAVAAALRNELQVIGEIDTRQHHELPHALVVDDDRSTRNALRLTLEADGFKVGEAADGTQALEILRRIRPDIILMDAVMPIMDGFDACEEIRKDPRTDSIPVLMITALEDDASTDRAFAVGATDILPKPIHFPTLSNRVRYIIRGSTADKRVRELAENDSLTGIPNRTLFFAALREAISAAHAARTPLGMMILNINQIRYVNDTYAPETGDKLLVEVAKRIRKTIGSTDRIARLGGDEFAVIIPSFEEPVELARIAEALCTVIANPTQVDEYHLYVTARIGIAVFPADGTDSRALLRAADSASKRAKADKNRFQFFEPSIEGSVSDRARAESDLKVAKDRKEFELYFQPISATQTGEIIAVEALLRWHHPTRGMLLPGEFIPLAEETGGIHALGEWVLERSCAQLAAWHGLGFDNLRMCVNTSIFCVLRPGFLTALDRIVKSSGIAPGFVELELSEGSFTERLMEVAPILKGIRSLGLSVSLDDFGTGYSMPADLQSVPLDRIKIDRSFLLDVPADNENVSAVSNFIGLAHRLGLTVIAEGVEKELQVDFLKRISCDYFQGHLLSVPVPAAQMEVMLMVGQPGGRSNPTIPKEPN